MSQTIEDLIDILIEDAQNYGEIFSTQTSDHPYHVDKRESAKKSLDDSKDELMSAVNKLLEEAKVAIRWRDGYKQLNNY